MRHGCFVRHFGKRRVAADVNHAVFFSKNSVYRVSHPTDHGDRGTRFLVAPRILKEIISEFDPSVKDHLEQPFAFDSITCDRQIFRRHRELVQRLENAAENPLEHLWADVTVLQLIADILESAFKKHRQPLKVRRQSTKTDHAEKTEFAKEYLADKLSESITLSLIAREVGASPFNFARIFQEQTGLPIHRYLTLLRLRASLERLSDGNDDLTSLALDLGFSSHSHFTDVFRREFGETPSDFRRQSSIKTIREISKNLIA
ncbi:MAG: AraC family transcriptional regulator [Actinomycetota bacterium]